MTAEKMNLAVKIPLILAIAAFAFIAFVRYLENSSVFYPNRTILATPEAVHLPYEEVSILTEDHLTLNAWFVPGRGTAPRGTLLFFHGNAGNIGDRLAKIQAFHDMGLNVFIVDYRGYGKSEGVPTETGLYTDALAAYDDLRGRRGVPPEAVVVYGASLGGAVAVDLAAREPVGALIVESSFPSAADVSRAIYPFIPTALLRTKMDSLSKIKAVKAPKLFLHGPRDEVIPFRLGKRLFEAAPPPKRFVELEGGHNADQTVPGGIWERAIRSFLKDHHLLTEGGS